jgi:hypothetical protein
MNRLILMSILFPVFFGCDHRMCQSPPISFHLRVFDKNNVDVLSPTYPGNISDSMQLFIFTNNQKALKNFSIDKTGDTTTDGKVIYQLNSNDILTASLDGNKTFYFRRQVNITDNIYFDEQPKVQNHCGYFQVVAFRYDSMDLTTSANNLEYYTAHLK